MENQRKEARAAALAQEKKNNTSMVVGAAAVGVPKADPNMESAKIANRLSYQPTSTAQNTYTPMSQPVKQPTAQQSVKPTTIQKPKPVTFSNIGTSNYLLSDNLKKAGESAKQEVKAAIEWEQNRGRLLSYDIDTATNQMEAYEKQSNHLEGKKRELEWELKYPSVTTSILNTQKELERITALLGKCNERAATLEQDIRLAGLLQENERYTGLPGQDDFAYYVNQGVALTKRDSDMKRDVAQLEQYVIAYNNLGMTDEMWAAQAEMERLNVLLGKDTKAMPGTQRDIETAKNSNKMLPAPEGNSIYEYMTDEERKKYYYLRGKVGKAGAQAYLDGLMDFLNSRRGIEMGTAVRGITNPVGRTVATGLYGLGTGADRYIRGVQQWLHDEKLPISPMQYGSQYIRNDLANVGRKIAGNSTGQMLYDGSVMVGNMLPSMMVSSVASGFGVPVKTAKALGAASIGISSSGNYYNEMLNLYPSEKAKQLAVVVGASEAALQYALGGIGKVSGLTRDVLLERAGGIQNALGRLLAKGAIYVGGEVAEEELELFLEPFYQMMILNEDYKAPTWDAMMETAMATVFATGFLEGPGLAKEAVTELEKWIENGDFWDNFNGDGWSGLNGRQWSPYGQLRPALADGWIDTQWQNEMPTQNKNGQAGDGFYYSKGNSQKGIDFHEDKYFERQVDHWNELEDGARVKVGKVQDGSALNQVGLPASGMYFDVGKIKKAMGKHNDHLTRDILKGIPGLLNDPVVITEYTGPNGDVKNTVNVYGDLYVKGIPVVVGVVMRLDRSGNCAINNVRTIHMRNDFYKHITDESVLYLNKDKRRTRSWFQVCGNLNVPLEGTKYGLIRSITFDEEKVNGSAGTDETTKNWLIMEGFMQDPN